MRLALVLLVLGLASLAPAQSLTTLFAQNNGGSPGGIVFFDIQVLNPAGIRILSFELNCRNQTTPQFTSDIYITPTTYIGKEPTQALWQRVSSGTGQTQPQDVPAPLAVTPFFLAQGTYGMGITNSVGQGYTNGTGANQNFGNADIALTLGAAMNVPFSGTPFTPRVWNGTIYYQVGGSSPAFFAFGQGCRGTNGIPTMAAAPGSTPRIGTVLQLEVPGLPAQSGPFFTILGTSDSSFGALTLPFALDGYGLTGCLLYVDLLLALPGPNVNGKGLITLPIPQDPLLVGAAVYLQAFSPDPGANRGGVIFSNYGVAYIGR